MTTLDTTSISDVNVETRLILYRKIAWRILPLLVVSYIVCIIDRFNISYAHLQIQKDLHLTESQYGFGVGIYYLGYILCEVPVMMMLARTGARRTISRIMISWGLICIAFSLVHNETHFYILRFLLGAAEGGFFPTLVIYLTDWFPAKMRGRVTASILFGIPVAGIVGNISAGAIMQYLDMVANLRGWQWLFVIEGVVPALIGIVAFFSITNDPREAKWLSDEERAFVAGEIAREKTAIAAKSRHSSGAFFSALRNPKVFVCAIAYAVAPWSSVVISYWSPSIIRSAGVTNVWYVGLLGAIPFVLGGLGMVWICQRSDRNVERRWHFAFSALVCGLSGCALIWFGGKWEITIFWLTLMTFGYLGATALFWTIPPGYLTGPEAAGAVAVISSVGYAGGFIAPAVIGWIQQATGHINAGLYLVALVLSVSAVTVVVGIPKDYLYRGEATD